MEVTVEDLCAIVRAPVVSENGCELPAFKKIESDKQLNLLM